MLTGGALQTRKEFGAWSGGSYRLRNPCCNLVGQIFTTDRMPYGCSPNSVCHPSFPSCHLHEDEELHLVVSLPFPFIGLVRLRGGALRAHVVKRGRSAAPPPRCSVPSAVEEPAPLDGHRPEQSWSRIRVHDRLDESTSGN